MIDLYTSLVQILEEIPRLALKSIEYELRRLKINDISASNCLILYKVGDSNTVTLKHIKDFYYVGINPTYSIQKMVDNGYLFQNINSNDKRISNLTLTIKGRDLYAKVKNILEKEIDYLKESILNENTIKDHYGFLIQLKDTLSKRTSGGGLLA